MNQTQPIKLTSMERIMRAHLQHYDPVKYWKRRSEVINPHSNKCKLLRYYLYYIKKCDAHNNATLGTHMGYGAEFAEIPNFPHGLYGIVMAHNVKIGKNSTIFHQVTIGLGSDGCAPVIGDDCLIGAGAKVLGGITIGNHVTIGAGSVVTFDVPDDCTVYATKGTIIKKK